MFFGHAAASRNLAELDLGEMVLTTDDIARADWTGSLVTLIGCETAALDTDHLPGTAFNHRERLPTVTATKVEHGLVLEKVDEIRDRLVKKIQGSVQIGPFGPPGVVSGSRLSGQGQQDTLTQRTHSRLQV